MNEHHYLVDTNILVYHTGGRVEATKFIETALFQHNLNISIITKIEFLGWNKHTNAGYEKCNTLIKNANVFMLEENTAEKTIELRRTIKKLKLGDAIIAATALVNNFILTTRNVDDFKMIKKLSLFNPFL